MELEEDDDIALRDTPCPEPIVSSIRLKEKKPMLRLRLKKSNNDKIISGQVELQDTADDKLGKINEI